MWSEAIAMLTHAERLHRQTFEPQWRSSRSPCWEPPVDVLETETEVIVFSALPGVDPEDIHAVIEDGQLAISGQRVLPQELQTALIHRLELPQGRFERRIPLPPGRYDGVRSSTVSGCLVVKLHKVV
jgi:HSP20 family molecular chaperone IbpA